MDVKHRIQLVELMKELNLPLFAVECGIAEGLFSRDLLEAGLDRLFLVDAWKTLPQTGDGGFAQEWHDKNYAEAVERVKPYGNKAVIIRELTVPAADQIPDGSLGMVYLDADHSFKGVLDDLLAWYPKVVHGGIIASHDFLCTDYAVKPAFEVFVSPFNGTGLIEIKIIPENNINDASGYFIKL